MTALSIFRGMNMTALSIFRGMNMTALSIFRGMNMTKGQKMRKHFGPQPITGPAACLRTAGQGRACARCDVKPETLHFPLRQIGSFCAACC